MSYMNESYNPRVKSMLKKIQNDYNEIANALGWNVDIDLINNANFIIIKIIFYQKNVKLNTKMSILNI